MNITNGIDVINIPSNKVETYDKYYDGYKIKPWFDYYGVELVILIEGNYLKEIIKIYKGGDVVLDTFPNKEESKDTIYLSDNDFERFKKLYERMNNKKDYRKLAIVNSYAYMLSYEFFQASYLEDIPDVTKEEILRDLNNAYLYKEYWQDIIAKCDEILKKEYNIG